MARRRHKRSNPKAKYKVRHVVLKKNPRRMRRNPADTSGIMAAEAARSEPEVLMYGPIRPRRGHFTSLKKKAKAQQKKTAASLRKRAAKMRKGAKGKGISAITRRAQAHRLDAIASVLAKRGKGVQKSPLVKAMTIKSNPGMAGVIESAKILAPVAAVGAVGLVGLSMAGRKISDMLIYEALPAGAAPGTQPALKKSLVDEKTGAPTMLATYAPALSTAALSAVAFVVADRVAPRYKGAIAIGGMLGAIVQAVGAAAMTAKPESLLAKAKSALSLGEYTTVGAGIFHGIGEYTTVGDAHPFRPRNFGDDQMEWAPLGEVSIQPRGGRDNATEFAPGEGGIFAKTPMLNR